MVYARAYAIGPYITTDRAYVSPTLPHIRLQT